MTIHTDQADLLELSGGSHATCIANDHNEILAEAVRHLQQTVVALTGRTVSHVIQRELAELIHSQFNDAGARVYFTSGGTEAVETAVRICHHIQRLRGRDASTVVGRDFSYHGMSLLARNISHHPVHSVLPEAVDLKWPKLGHLAR